MHVGVQLCRYNQRDRGSIRTTSKRQMCITSFSLAETIDFWSMFWQVQPKSSSLQSEANSTFRMQVFIQLSRDNWCDACSIRTVASPHTGFLPFGLVNTSQSHEFYIKPSTFEHVEFDSAGPPSLITESECSDIFRCGKCNEMY